MGDPTCRPSADECLRSPWFAIIPGTTVPTRSLSPGVVPLVSPVGLSCDGNESGGAATVVGTTIGWWEDIAVDVSSRFGLVQKVWNCRHDVLRAGLICCGSWPPPLTKDRQL